MISFRGQFSISSELGDMILVEPHPDRFAEITIYLRLDEYCIMSSYYQLEFRERYGNGYATLARHTATWCYNKVTFNIILATALSQYSPIINTVLINGDKVLTSLCHYLPKLMPIREYCIAAWNGS